MHNHGMVAGSGRGRGRKKNTWKNFKRLVASMGEHKFLLLIAVIFAVGSVAMGIFIPKVLGDITNVAVETYPNIDFGRILGLVWIVLGLLVGSAILNYTQAMIITYATAKYVRKLRSEIFAKITRLPIAYMDKHQHGDTLSRMTNDIEVIDTSLSQEITDMTLSFSTLIGVMIIMLTISVPLSLVSFFVIPFSVLVVGKIMGRAQKYFGERQKTLGELNGIIEEDYAGQIIIKANAHEKASIADFEGKNVKLAKLTERAQLLSSLAIPVTHLFTNLGYVLVVILGGLITIEGGITIGALQAFIQYVSRFNRPITEAASTTATLQSLLAATGRVFEFLDAEEEAPDALDAKEISEVRGEVEFHDVCFGYSPDKPVIRNFSVKVSPGMKVAIVGPTGAGKTTLINLLMRFYEPTSGYITIDGVPTSEMKRAEVRKMFGMVLQDTWLFNGTVEENLRYGKQKASLAEIKEAAKASNVDHVIEALPKNYRAEISEDSDNISAGEKQLITIARAMLARPPMMILDEATSNVDTRTEQLIQDSFERLTRGRTSFVIAHRLSTIRNSDLILVMKNGAIVEQGSHEELLGLGGFYAELYNSQFAEE